MISIQVPALLLSLFSLPKKNGSVHVPEEIENHQSTALNVTCDMYTAVHLYLCTFCAKLSVDVDRTGPQPGPQPRSQRSQNLDVNVCPMVRDEVIDSEVEGPDSSTIPVGYPTRA